jgi:hypothetical protein
LAAVRLTQQLRGAGAPDHGAPGSGGCVGADPRFVRVVQHAAMHIDLTALPEDSGVLQSMIRY